MPLLQTLTELLEPSNRTVYNAGVLCNLHCSRSKSHIALPTGTTDQMAKAFVCCHPLDPMYVGVLVGFEDRLHLVLIVLLTFIFGATKQWTLQQRMGHHRGALAKPTHCTLGKVPYADGLFESLSGTISCAIIARSTIDSDCNATPRPWMTPGIRSSMRIGAHFTSSEL